MRMRNEILGLECPKNWWLQLPLPLLKHCCVLLRLRAYIEKEGRKARANTAWHKRMDLVGRHQHVNVTRFNDLRLIDRHNVPKEWTEQEIWNFITMDGTAADPRDVVIKVRSGPLIYTSMHQYI